jgi:hypothetical protein
MQCTTLHDYLFTYFKNQRSFFEKEGYTDSISMIISSKSSLGTIDLFLILVL